MSVRSAVRRRAAVAVAVVVALAASGCSGADDDAVTSTTTSTAPLVTDTVPADCGPEVVPEGLGLELIDEVPHDPDAFTQGFLVIDGVLYESTGQRGRSTVRKVDPDTGEVLESTDLDPELFGEGLATVGDDRLVQLTWTEGRALVWDREDLTLVGEHTYEGEGWGITTLDDGQLVMSDGSDVLTFRDPEDFSVVRRIRITRPGGAADQLNELEWDGEHLWANRWRTDEIVRIDLRCGRVDGVIDATALRLRAESTAEEDEPIDVLNGIAHVPDTDELLLTGKEWPSTYRVRVLPAGP